VVQWSKVPPRCHQNRCPHRRDCLGAITQIARRERLALRASPRSTGASILCRWCVQSTQGSDRAASDLAFTGYYQLQFCMVYGIQKGGCGGIVYCAMYIVRWSCNITVIVWPIQMGKGKTRMIRSCTKALKYTNILSRPSCDRARSNTAEGGHVSLRSLP